MSDEIVEITDFIADLSDRMGSNAGAVFLINDTETAAHQVLIYRRVVHRTFGDDAIPATVEEILDRRPTVYPIFEENQISLYEAIRSDPMGCKFIDLDWARLKNSEWAERWRNRGAVAGIACRIGPLRSNGSIQGLLVMEYPTELEISAESAVILMQAVAWRLHAIFNSPVKYESAISPPA